MSISVIVIIMEHEVSGCLPSFRGFGLMKGGMHMKKRVYIIKFLNRLCIIILLIVLMLLIIKIDI